jgi:lipid-A-disaccharide synthase
VVASGTATLETALLGTPMIMVYRVSGLTWMLGRRLVKVDRFAMPNLIAGHDVVPELVQDGFTAPNIMRELQRIIPDGPERQRMLEGLAEVRAKLQARCDDGFRVSDRVAAAILKIVQHDASV